MTTPNNERVLRTYEFTHHGQQVMFLPYDDHLEVVAALRQQIVDAEDALQQVTASLISTTGGSDREAALAANTAYMEQYHS